MPVNQRYFFTAVKMSRVKGHLTVDSLVLGAWLKAQRARPRRKYFNAA